MHNVTLPEVVRSLLWHAKYTGPMCHKEFGVGLSWYSEFMSGKYKNPNATVLQSIYEKITGQPLIDPKIVDSIQLIDPVKIGTGGQYKRKNPVAAPPPPPTKKGQTPQNA